MYKQADAALCLWIVIPNFVVNPKAKSSLRAGDDNNNKYKDNNEHFVNPVFMRNYVFFALVSQAVTETRRVELTEVENGNLKGNKISARRGESTFVGCRPFSLHPPLL